MFSTAFLVLLYAFCAQGTKTGTVSVLVSDYMSENASKQFSSSWVKFNEDGTSIDNLLTFDPSVDISNLHTGSIVSITGDEKRGMKREIVF